MGQVANILAGPAALTARRKPLNALTGIRFFAAAYVLAFHTRIGATLLEHGHAMAGNFFVHGYMAVPVFFLLSGFILSYTYEGQIEKPGDHRRFWEARFARIWPVYALSLVLASVVFRTVPPPGTAIATLLMVQAWNPFNLDLAGAWNAVCWTLSVEAFFYLVFPWLQVWVEKLPARRQLALTLFMLVLCIAGNTASRKIGYTPYGAYRYIPYPLLHLPEFITGVAIGNYFLRRLALVTMDPGKKMVPGGGAWTWIAAVASLGLLCLPEGRWASVVVPAFAALLYGLAAEKTALSRMLSTPLLILGGGISFSIYLMQLIVKAAVNQAADHLHLASQTIRAGCSTVLVILVSLILFKWFEEPCRRLVRGFFARIEQRRSPV